MDLPGVDVQPMPHRSYRYGALGGHLIGYMNEVGADELRRLNEELARAGSPQGPYLLGDYTGRRGLEKRFERELRGVDGKRRIAVDAKGREKEGELHRRGEPGGPGQRPGATSCSRSTGGCRSWPRRPSRPPPAWCWPWTPRPASCWRWSTARRPTRTRCRGASPPPSWPGSTTTRSSPSSSGPSSSTTTPAPPSRRSPRSRRWRRGSTGPARWSTARATSTWGRRAGAATTRPATARSTSTHALGASCDVFYYTAGAQLGADLLAKWARKLGLGAPTGFDVAGEVPGVIPDVAWHDARVPGGYQKGMAVNLAIGQGDVNVTPMQQLVLYGALATGILWKPQVVLRVEDTDGQVLQEFAPQERGRLDLKPSTRETVLKGLLAAVNQPYGTAYWQRLPDMQLAGKTGTAQVVKLGARRLKAEQVGLLRARPRLVRGLRARRGSADRGGGAQRALRLRLDQRRPHRGGAGQGLLQAQGQGRGRAGRDQPGGSGDRRGPPRRRRPSPGRSAGPSSAAPRHPPEAGHG